jgi:fructose transport system substrate-binding protein
MGARPSWAMLLHAKIATLDLNPSQISVDYLRNQGFLQGFGIDVKDPTRIGDEDDARIIGNDVTNGNEEGGRTAMENLLQKDPEINRGLYDQRTCCRWCI